MRDVDFLRVSEVKKSDGIYWIGDWFTRYGIKLWQLDEMKVNPKEWEIILNMDISVD